MPKMLKEEVKDALSERIKEIGLEPEEFFAKMADETTATTEEEVLEFITKNEHPVATLQPMF